MVHNNSISNFLLTPNSDWGGDRDNRKVIDAYVFRISDGAISWKTKMQTSVTLSSVEAEYIAMCQATEKTF